MEVPGGKEKSQSLLRMYTKHFGTLTMYFPHHHFSSSLHLCANDANKKKTKKQCSPCKCKLFPVRSQTQRASLNVWSWAGVSLWEGTLWINRQDCWMSTEGGAILCLLKWARCFVLVTMGRQNRASSVLTSDIGLNRPRTWCQCATCHCFSCRSG